MPEVGCCNFTFKILNDCGDACLYKMPKRKEQTFLLVTELPGAALRASSFGTSTLASAQLGGRGMCRLPAPSPAAEALWGRVQGQHQQPMTRTNVQGKAGAVCMPYETQIKGTASISVTCCQPLANETFLACQ